MIKKENNALRIFDKHQDVDTDSPWQEEIYNVSNLSNILIVLLVICLVHNSVLMVDYS